MATTAEKINQGRVKMQQKKLSKIAMLILGCIIVSLIFLLAYNSIIINKTSNVTAEDINKSSLVKALESYYGEWEIVEDYGYHGVHRTIQIEKFTIGKTIIFQREVFRYEDSINVPYPKITIEMTSSAKMQGHDKILYPFEIGFDNPDVQYAKIKIYDRPGSPQLEKQYWIYVLNDREIIIEGDVHRYYRAVKKN